jgi:hypothetical protein
VVRGRVVRSVAGAVVLAGFVAAGCSLRRSVGPPPSPYCRGGDPLAGVYHPARLSLRSWCRVAVGTVERVRFEQFDGDVHVDLRLDPGYEGLASDGNAAVGGDLIVEIIPQDRSVVAVPEEGARIEVVGPWVDDSTHGWREIHPAWWVSSGRIVPATPDELRRVQELLARGSGGRDPDS